MFLSVSCVTTTSLAQVSLCDDQDINAPYETSYYKDEGGMSVKLRLSGILSHAGQKGLPAPLSGQQHDPVGKFVENGYGGDVSTTIFFNRYFGAELSLGFNVLRTKYSSLENIHKNYYISPTTPAPTPTPKHPFGKRRDVFMIPATVIGQFHIAPFGGIRPYVGIGYHASYLFTRSKGFKIKNGHGAVGQIGIDFYAKNDTMINIDVRQFFLKPKVIYKEVVVGKNHVTSKAKLNPLVISIGIGFNF